MNRQLQRYLSSQGLHDNWSSSLRLPKNTVDRLLTGDLWGKNVMGIFGTSLEHFLEGVTEGQLQVENSRYLYFYPKDLEGLRHCANKVGVTWYWNRGIWKQLEAFEHYTPKFINDACEYAEANGSASYLLRTLGIEVNAETKKWARRFVEAVDAVVRGDIDYYDYQPDVLKAAKFFNFPSDLTLLKALYRFIIPRKGVLIGVTYAALHHFKIETGDANIKNMNFYNEDIDRPDFRFVCSKGFPLSYCSVALPLGPQEIKELSNYLPRYSVHWFKKNLKQMGFKIDKYGGYTLTD